MYDKNLRALTTGEKCVISLYCVEPSLLCLFENCYFLLKTFQAYKNILKSMSKTLSYSLSE